MKTITNILVCLAILLGTGLQAATTTWTDAALDKDWHNPLNWSGQTVPTANDIVVFDKSITYHNCEINQPAVAAGISITNYQGKLLVFSTLTVDEVDLQDGTIQLKGGTATINTSVVIDGGDFDGDYSSSTETLYINGDVEVISGDFTTADHTYFNNSEILIDEVDGNWCSKKGHVRFLGDKCLIEWKNQDIEFHKISVDLNNGEDLKVNRTSITITSRFNAITGGIDKADLITIKDTLYIGPALTKWNTSNAAFETGCNVVVINENPNIDPFPSDLVIDNLGGGSVMLGSNGMQTYVGVDNKNLYVNSGTLKFAPSGTVDLGFEEIHIAPGAEIVFQGDVNLAVETFINDGGKITNNGGRVRIEMDHNLDIDLEPGDRFPELYISIDSTSGGNTVKMVDHGDTLFAQGDVSLMNGKIQNGILATEGDLFVHESWDKFDDTEIMFTGDARQTWESYTKADRYEERIIINKTSHEVVELLSDIHLKKKDADLYLKWGIIQSSQDAMLILDKDIQVYGGHNFSHVYGPVRKIGKTEFEFPLGKNLIYAPISISEPDDDKHHFTAEYFIGDPSNAGYDRSIKEPGINEISNCEFWILDRTNGTSNVEVTLSTGGQRSCYMGELDSMYVLRWDGSMWRNHGNGGTTGSYEYGTFKTAGLVTNFSPFGGGGGDNGGILSTKFIDCTAEVMGAEVLVQWRTAVENSAAYFKVERSKNGIDWEEVGMEVAVGISPEVNNYNTTDWNPWKGDTYYRVIEVDQDGNEVLSPTTMVNIASGSIGHLVVYPNPSKGTFSLELNDETTIDEIHVRNILGQELAVDIIDRGSSMEISVIGASSGTYFVNVRTGTDTKTYPITINQ